ncbi:MAG: L-rhamnose mutarotase [Paludibacter sp.]|nr:L-rhamnose mutarotase [Paludibacter sp.]
MGNYSYPVKKFPVETKRYCQTLSLKNDSQLIEEYKYWHRTENRWPEIPEGIRAIGILEMEIYIHGNLLFMIVETPVDFDWDKSFARLAGMNRQAEWESFMAKFQVADSGAASSDKWQLMERMFSL